MTFRLMIPATGDVAVVPAAETNARTVFATETTHTTREAAERELDRVLEWWDAA